MEAVVDEHLLGQSGAAGVLRSRGHEVELTVACGLEHGCKSILSGMAGSRRNRIHDTQHKGVTQTRHIVAGRQSRIFSLVKSV